GDSQDRGGIGLGQAGDQPQQERGARPVAQARQPVEGRLPARRGGRPPQRGRRQQHRPEASWPVPEGGAAGLGGEPLQRPGQPLPGLVVAAGQEAREDQPPAVDATQEGAQGGGRGGIAGGGRRSDGGHAGAGGGARS